MTDPQLEILRNEIREGFRASAQRDNALGAQVDAIQEGLSDVRFAVNSIMNALLAPSETHAIRKGMKTPQDVPVAERAGR